MKFYMYIALLKDLDMYSGTESLTGLLIDNHFDKYANQPKRVMNVKTKSARRDCQDEKGLWEPMPCGGSFLIHKSVGLIKFDNAECSELSRWMTAWGADVFSASLSRPEDIYHLNLETVSFIVLVGTNYSENSLSSETAQRIRQANCEVPIVFAGDNLETMSFTATTPLFDATLSLPTTETGLSLALSAASTNNLSIDLTNQPDYQSRKNIRPNIRPSFALERRLPTQSIKDEHIGHVGDRWMFFCMLIAVVLISFSMLSAVALTAYGYLTN